MTLFKAWISAARLHTLPLSIAGVLIGSAMGYETLCLSNGRFSWSVFGLTLLTIVLLQILSNFANDLGDSQKGTDNELRVGPKRAVQSGLISKTEMKYGVFTTALTALISGTLLLWIACKQLNIEVLILFFIGLAGIAAAIRYTIGENAYGYKGYADVFVLFFFGIIPVTISFYLQVPLLRWSILLPAISVGLFSTAVLNLNNLRDYENDKACGKKTIIVRLGIENGKKYHTALLLLGMLSTILYSCFLSHSSCWQHLYGIAFLFFLANILKVWKTKDTRLLNPELKKVALATFLFALLFSLGLTL